MQVLREIIKRSSVKPKGGLKAELYHLVNEKDYDDQKIKEHFNKIGKIKQLHSVNRHLKEYLLEDILTSSLFSLNKALRKRIRLLKRKLQAKILLYTGSKIAGIKLAIDTIVMAEKGQDFETVHALCRELIIQFSIVQPDIQKYRKYRKKMEEAWQHLTEELLAEKTYGDIVHSHNTKEPIDVFPEQFRQLDQIALSNKHYKFNYYYYSTKSFYYQLTKDYQQLIDNNKAAYHFFEQLNLDLHYAIKLSFLSELIPYYIIEQKFGLADSTIHTCLEMPLRGTYNWHRILIYKAATGFYSNKPDISLSAYKTAQSIKKKFDNQVITEKWHLIKGYLALYHKSQRIHYDANFKLSKFLNIEEKQKNDEQKANLIILELLHLLADGKRSLFYKKLERVEGYIATRFRAHTFKRTRHFLRLLKCVVKGNYHIPLVQAHGKKQLKNLKNTKDDLEVHIIDLEIVPYELLWEVALGFLRR